ncbi:helicase associated domain-containing protein [Streptomyces goshikiensis]|uniref:helicase associated domain-containing protein n=1 Tax=Streptomyces goshikiensis TaxID=1942 RepID=UPI003681D3A4
MQGEDLGLWLRSQRLSWERLSWAQRWLLEHTLGAAPAAGAELPPPRVAHRGGLGGAPAPAGAARRFHERERHPRVPRTHVERGGGREFKPGSWMANQRSRAASLAPERVEALTALGMRWPASA